MSIYVILGWSVGILAFLYFFWKRLREDYLSFQIFTSYLYILLGSVIFASLAVVIFRGYGFWGVVIGSIAGIVLSVRRLGFKFVELLEASGIGMLIAGLFITLGRSIPTSLIFAGVIIIFFILEGKYKNFTWYKSGKVGFSGLVTLGVFFLLRGVVAYTNHFVLSFDGRSRLANLLLSSLSALTLFFLVYRLGKTE